jgi:hypothetical protein
MAPKRWALNGRIAIAVALAAATLFGFGPSALAGRDTLRNALGLEHMDEGRAGASPQIARYLIDEGGVFVLDRSATPHPLLKFDDSPEIWVLSQAHGPRGDIIYKNDVGETVLRATRLGGMTVFTLKRPAGSAAALVGPTAPLRMPTLGPVVLYQRLFQASVRATRSAQHLVEFEAPDADAYSDALIADAAVITVEAFATLASQPDGRQYLGRVGKIAFAEGAKPQVGLQGGVLTVVVAPKDGIAGRPSSRRILKAVSGR